MKIIDKRGTKDYYDYLAGIYGIDEKIVLDRRGRNFFGYIPEKFTLHIAGYVVEGLCIRGKFYYGEALNKFKVDKNSRRYWLSKHLKRDYKASIEVYHADMISAEWVYIKPMKDPENVNDKENCAVIISRYGNTYYKFPLLKDFNLGSFVPAAIVYKWLDAWLSVQITKKEDTSVGLTDKEKISNKGFDKKSSFRPKMK